MKGDKGHVIHRKNVHLEWKNSAGEEQNTLWAGAEGAKVAQKQMVCKTTAFWAVLINQPNSPVCFHSHFLL